MRRPLRILFEQIDRFFGTAFSPPANPMPQLGAMGWFFYWIVVATGVYLYIFYDTGVNQAYASVESITHSQRYAGGIMRSLHRYASDALVVVVLVHLVREFALDRFRGPRSFAWLTGVPLLWFMYASGITGYWIVWDKFAQYVAIATTEWLDTLPFFAEPIARNFLNDSTLSGRFFTLFVFIHIAVPLFMLFLMWLHIHRHSQPRVNPPRELALGCLAALLALAIAYPATSQGPAVLSEVPAVVRMDWYYFPVYPLLDRYPGALVWMALAAATLVLFVTPWIVPRRDAKLRIAEVDLDNCNGCGLCVRDCPFSAVTLRPRSDGLPFIHEAIVDPDLCVSCGICAGACPSATPFRRRSKLIPGIQLPDFPIAGLREDMQSAMKDRQGPGRILVIGCTSGPDLKAGEAANAGMVQMPCIGMLPASFLDFILSRGHADGVVLSGCEDCDCQFRLGQRWTQMRVARQRDPALRERVRRDRIAFCWAGVTGRRRLVRQVAALRQSMMH